ncbi:MAG: cytochrome d ubiquinol oxidase subunit II [Planctomycetota bacterium]
MLTDPAFLVLNVVLAALTLYVIFGGADFGAGVWELNSALQASEKERRLIYRAIGPVWEANHVWLIFFLMGLFNGFPRAFAALSRALWIPLLLALVGIVFRGAAYVYRSYSAPSESARRELWGGVFAVASTTTPFFLGAGLGTLASGVLPIDAEGRFDSAAGVPWISALGIFTAFFGVVLCAYLAAVFLAREAQRAGDSDLIRLWRQRALASGIWAGVLAVVGLVFVSVDVPTLWKGLVEQAIFFVAVSLTSGVASLVCLWFSKFTLACVLSGVAVATVIWSWGVAQYPVLIPPALTVEASQAPDDVLWLMLMGMLGGAVLLVPSLFLLFRVFKSGGSDEASRTA